MPTLLQINSCINVNSTGRLAEDIGNVAISNGWESYIAYGRDYRPSRSHEIKIGNKFSVTSDILMTRLFDLHGHGAYFATKRFLHELETIKPDVIQLHNIHGYFLNHHLFFDYVAKRDIPVFWSLHDCWSMTGHCGHFVGVGCDKWKKECHHCPLLKDYPNSWLIDSSRRNYNDKKRLFNSLPRLTIIPTSEWLGNLVRQSYLKNHNIIVIPDGVDTTIFSPQIERSMEIRHKLGLDGKFVVLASGTVWADYKGIPYYIKLRESLSDDYAIVFVGMSTTDIERLKPSCKGIIMNPRTNSIEELAAYYTMADCVMSLSKMESFGLTAVEGYACGTPAIVNNSTALPELITKKTGFVVNSDNIQDIIEKLNVMRRNGKDYYSKSCRELALRQYSKEAAYSKYLKLYSQYL